MKILIVLTSHDQLGDTGKKTGFWLEAVCRSLLRAEGCRSGDHAGLAEGRPAAGRSDKRSTRKPDQINEALPHRHRCAG